MDSNWQGEESSVRKRTEVLLKRNCWTDVSFAVSTDAIKPKTDSIKAHKIILANASVVFETMFFGNLPEDTTKDILIDDITPKIFTAMLKFIYAEELEFETWEDLMELCYAAKKYMLNALLKKCISALIDSLTTENALHLYEFAGFHNFQNLLEAALKIFQCKTQEILKSPYFDNIAISTLKAIVTQDQLQVSELEIFQAVEKTALRKGVIKNLKRYPNTKPTNSAAWREIRAIVSEIRFLSMRTRDFQNGPGFSALLSSDEAFSITVCQSLPDKTKTVYPQGFTQKKRKMLPRVFFDIKADEISLGRIVVELRPDVVPVFAENFLKFCLGESKYGLKGAKLDIINDKYCCGHAIDLKTGKLTKKVLEPKSLQLKHDRAGIVGVPLCNADKHKRCMNAFYITFVEMPNWDGGAQIPIGKVIDGISVLQKIRNYGQTNGQPIAKVVIENCGKL